MTNWTEIIISVPLSQSEKAESIANMVVPYGIYIEDYSMLEEEVLEIAHIDMIDDELLNKQRDIVRVHIYLNPEENPNEALAFLKERFNSENVEYKIETDSCVEEDWMHNWKKYFNPIPVGEKLLIRPTWRDDFDPDGRIVLNLDPGIAFGSGTHETTRLCLASLEKYITSETDMLDVGCGSGILAISALLLGAKSALGIDIDPLAVKTSHENAKINNVEDKFECRVGNLTDKVSGKYNVICANIVADAIIALSKDVKNFMDDDTIYIMSGIIDTRLDDVLNELKDDYDIIETKTEKGWYCLTAKIKK